MAKQKIPSYRLHKAWGLAVVRLDGKDIYLGKHGSPESRAEYNRVIAEWLTSRRAALLAEPGSGPPPDLTVAELVDGFFEWADGYYVKNGRPTSEINALNDAVRPLVKLYGLTRAADFGPLALNPLRSRPGNSSTSNPSSACTAMWGNNDRDTRDRGASSPPDKIWSSSLTTIPRKPGRNPGSPATSSLARGSTGHPAAWIAVPADLTKPAPASDDRNSFANEVPRNARSMSVRSSQEVNRAMFSRPSSFAIWYSSRANRGTRCVGTPA
ncbi:MAG: hypothetical protein R3B68_16875 [Phycisphaerales bacterium]